MIHVTMKIISLRKKFNFVIYFKNIEMFDV
jgi:hypothetical protein